MDEVTPDRAVFSISVASELTDVAPQMLRVYEQRGLVHPQRTPGGTRRYSGQDVERIREITGLLGEGLNLAGIERVLQLQGRERATAGADRAAALASLSARPAGAAAGRRAA